MRRMRRMIVILALLVLLVPVATAATPSNVVVDGNPNSLEAPDVEWPADSYAQYDDYDDGIPTQYDILDVYATQNTAGTEHYIRYETGTPIDVQLPGSTSTYYDLDDDPHTGRSEVCDGYSIGAETRVLWFMAFNLCYIYQWNGNDWGAEVSTDCGGAPFGPGTKAGTTVEMRANASDVGLSGGLIAVKIIFENNDSSGPPDDIVCFTYVEYEGCTPGYWRQTQHLDYWVDDYLPGDFFFDTFDVVYDSDPDLTLLEAVWLRGGGEAALARHAVAALLNAAKTDVSYKYSAEEIIFMVQNAYATDDFETPKDDLVAQNEAGCPLD